jgi:hypothetical protein
MSRPIGIVMVENGMPETITSGAGSPCAARIAPMSDRAALLDDQALVGPALQHLDEVRVDLDREQPRLGLHRAQERARGAAGAGTELDDQLARGARGWRA